MTTAQEEDSIVGMVHANWTPSIIPFLLQCSNIAICICHPEQLVLCIWHLEQTVWDQLEVYN
jgi:hypothetical protein